MIRRLIALAGGLIASGWVAAAVPVSVTVEGPEVINSSVDRRVSYVARLHYDDGSSRVIDTYSELTWTIYQYGGASPQGRIIDAAGTFAVEGQGVITLIAWYDGAPNVGGQKTISIVNGAPSNQPFALGCGAVEAPILADYATAALVLGPTSDILPLCGRDVLIASTSFNRVEALDVVDAKILHSWQLVQPPLRMARAQGTSYVFVLFAAALAARIDLASDEVVYFPLPGAPRDAFDGQPGEIWITTDLAVSRYDVATAGLLGTHPAIYPFGAYDRFSRRLFTGGQGSLERRIYDPVARTLGAASPIATVGTNVVGVALSPNGKHVIAPAMSGNGASYSSDVIWDIDPADLTLHFGAWAIGYSPQGAAFRFDGKKLLAINDTRFAVFDVYTHVEDVGIRPIPISPCSYLNLRNVRWSPLARNVYMLNLCDGTQAGEKALVYSSLPAPTALFVAKQGGGTGRVTGTPGILDCGVECVDSFTAGTTVTLTAAADASSTFVEWAGCPAPSGTQCTVTLNGATTVSARFRGPQSIAFAAFGVKTYGDAPFTVSASASSGLTVSLAASPASVCTISGSVVTLVGAGLCTLDATQGGNVDYSSALASASFQVLPATTVVSLSASSAPAYLGNDLTLIAMARGNGRDATGNVRIKDGTTVICDVPLVSGRGQCTTTRLAVGTHSLSAEYPGSTNFTAAISPTLAEVVRILATGATSLALGTQSMGTTSTEQVITLSNSTLATITVTGISTGSPYFTQTNDCGVLAPGASCRVHVTFTPLAGLPLGGTADYAATLTVMTDRSPTGDTFTLAGTARMSLVLHYYRTILRREPDANGQAFWESEAARVANRGANVNEAWYSMAMQFYGGAEYAAFGRDDAAYVTDLYRTFFNRAPDAAGLAFWGDQMSRGLVRDALLTSFMFSSEFVNFTRAIFGNTAARAEVDVVMDFYRGFLGRLPDNAGFDFWLSVFRSAQCTGAAAVTTQVDAISGAFASSPEYLQRSRSNVLYVSDLYNAFMRRGPDVDGLLFWKGQLDGGRVTRDQLRKSFLASPEFNQRVNAVIAQGCMR